MAASQRQTLQLFTALRLAEPHWPGKLLLGLGLQDEGRALALAALGAGAAVLMLEEDEATLRAANREGCVTFAVKTLDEALRALKNEVRQRHAIVVALSGEPIQWLAEMAERGVLPDFIACIRKVHEIEKPALQTLHEQGSRDLNLAEMSAALDGWQIQSGWQMVEDTAANLAERRERDAALLASSKGLMRDWLRAAPTLFPRELNRAVLQRR
jgi:hypothetical protein